MPEGRPTTGSVLIVDDDGDIRETLFEAVAQTDREFFPRRTQPMHSGFWTDRTSPVLASFFSIGRWERRVGSDFLEALRARLDSASPRTPSAQEVGVVGFLRKPFDIAALEAVLDEHA
jgi:hypothetical protein